MADKFSPQELKDGLSSFEAGVNMGVSPLILPRNQTSYATNVTFRGTYATHRPPVRKLRMDLATGQEAGVKTALIKGLWQDGTFYNPDNGAQCLMAATSGNLFQLEIGDSSVRIKQVSTPTTTQSPSAPQHWMWQSELYIIWNDGVSLPVFYTSNPASSFVIRRSNYGIKGNFGSFNTVAFVVPAVGASVSGVTFNSVANLVVGDSVKLSNVGQFTVQDITGSDVTLLNVSATPVGLSVAIAASNNFFWSHTGQQLPPGRMGAYGMGRNWICLVDGKQFVASDIEGGPSGTQSLNYRDAVLNITENSFLVGGGNFSVPGSIGDITAMRFGATLDASLGQGPLQVFTSSTVFSCNTPVDRLTWQSLQNPILTESLISNGALGHNSTVLANGDFLFRSVDGIRSLILARREFDTWGNVVQSREVATVLDQDDIGLLKYGSAVTFDNRLLMTANPVQGQQGVFHRKLIALNFDPLSNLRGKAPAIYDGQWIGLNVLKLIVGKVGGFDRCFAFTYNEVTQEIELYEILKSQPLDHNTHSYPIYDNDDPVNGRIVWSIESAALFNRLPQDTGNELLKKLLDGEMSIDNLVGQVDFQVFWKPDQWPCWVPWHAWTECSSEDSTTTTKPSFRPLVGLGEPSSRFCDLANDRPLREFFTMQWKVVITGHCRFLKLSAKSTTIPHEYVHPPAQCCINGVPVPLPTPQSTSLTPQPNPDFIGDVFGDVLTGDIFGDPNSGDMLGTPP